MTAQVASLAISVPPTQVKHILVQRATTVLLKVLADFILKNNTHANWEHGTRKLYKCTRLTAMIVFLVTIVIKPR